MDDNYLEKDLRLALQWLKYEEKPTDFALMADKICTIFPHETDGETLLYRGLAALGYAWDETEEQWVGGRWLQLQEYWNVYPEIFGRPSPVVACSECGKLPTHEKYLSCNVVKKWIFYGWECECGNRWMSRVWYTRIEETPDE